MHSKIKTRDGCQISLLILNELNLLNANPTKWSSNLPTNCLSVFDHFMNLVLKGLRELKLIKL